VQPPPSAPIVACQVNNGFGGFVVVKVGECRDKSVVQLVIKGLEKTSQRLPGLFNTGRPVLRPA
jgi:hypothetical protein